ncbi:scp-domain-containing protein [Fusarium sporotrichioides]|uniref:Scp-domain-containing protein n=1 Tax=Fusarium sporotrichioides TaxID=5514 RepID=A0A395RF85_FUSSP|nr:scp-domain-containing protein [Fusarium sporotrichioides]
MLKLFVLIALPLAECLNPAVNLAVLGPDCDEPVRTSQSYGGCIAITNTHLQVVLKNTIAEKPSTDNKVDVFLYNRKARDGRQTELASGLSFDTEIYHSAKIVEINGKGPKVATTDAFARFKYHGSPYSRSRTILQAPSIIPKSSQKRPSRPFSTTDAHEHHDRVSDRGSKVLSVQQEVVHLINDERSANGCDRLASSSNLEIAAQEHSEDMAERNYFDHTTPEGLSFSDRLTNAGYLWSNAAENIAQGQSTPADVVRSWMENDGHRENILNCELEDTGVGAAQSQDGSWLWTQDFASPAASEL